MNIYKLHKQIFALFLICCIPTFIACNDESKGSLHKHTAYNFDFTEYTALPSNSFPYINGFFTPSHAAQDLMPNWLISRYFSASEGSTADITYDFKNYDRPEYLEKLNREIKEFDGGDYNLAWGDVYANFFTPKVSPSHIPEILAAREEAEEGDFRIVQYNYSSTNAIVNNEKISYFSENFNALSGGDWAEFDYPGWFNKELFGVGLRWRVKHDNVNRIATAYSRGRTGSSSWLINMEPIDLRYASNPVLTFNYGLGYLDTSNPSESFDCMTMYVTKKFDGKDPSLSGWDDVSDTAGIREIEPASGYPDRPLMTLDLKNYTGDYFHVGFHYHLPLRQNPYSLAPLYYVDNIEVWERRDVAKVDATMPLYEIFTYSNNTWEKATNSYYVLQEEDYLTLNTLYLTLLQASELIPPLLQTKFPDVSDNQNIIVAYRLNDTSMGASEFIFNGNRWIEAGGNIEKKTDRYVYSEATGWEYAFTHE